MIRRYFTDSLISMINTPYTPKQVGDATKDLTKKAQHVWDERSAREREGIFAALAIIVGAALVALVWRAGSNRDGYVELPRIDDEPYRRYEE